MAQRNVLRYFTATLKVTTRWILGPLRRYSDSIHFIPLGSWGWRLPEGAAPFVFTIEILSTAIGSVEHPLEGILIVRMHPFVSTI